MEYVKFSAYHVPVLYVHQCLTNLGFPVFSKKNRHTTNLSSTVLIGQLCSHITITPKSIPSENFDDIHQVVLNVISENMASLVQSDMCGAINTYDNK